MRKLRHLKKLNLCHETIPDSTIYKLKNHMNGLEVFGFVLTAGLNSRK